MIPKKMSSFFQFKQFKVYHDKSSMKVGTDAVLLGSLINMRSSENILDIGCGSGIISLIAAQKCQANIVGIDIDEASIIQANENFELSKWKDRLKAERISLQDARDQFHTCFDLIISNPPFFVNSMKSPLEKRNLARHNDLLNSFDLLSSVKTLLSPMGKLALILPAIEGEEFIQQATKHDFYLERKIFVQPKPSKKANRLVLEFKLQACDYSSEIYVIREENDEYTQAYRQLTKDFYLAF
jgi:tRNA1Val (adenine37-N6)-methyltransferase